MNLSKEKLEQISRYYFYGGFAFLPWLWLVNFCLLFPVIRAKPETSKVIKKSIISRGSV